MNYIAVITINAAAVWAGLQLVGCAPSASIQAASERAIAATSPQNEIETHQLRIPTQEELRRSDEAWHAADAAKVRLKVLGEQSVTQSRKSEVLEIIQWSRGKMFGQSVRERAAVLLTMHMQWNEAQSVWSETGLADPLGCRLLCYLARGETPPLALMTQYEHTAIADARSLTKDYETYAPNPASRNGMELLLWSMVLVRGVSETPNLRGIQEHLILRGAEFPVVLKVVARSLHTHGRSREAIAVTKTALRRMLAMGHPKRDVGLYSHLRSNLWDYHRAVGEFPSDEFTPPDQLIP